MNIAITGTGGIGSGLASVVSKTKHQVVVSDRKGGTEAAARLAGSGVSVKAAEVRQAVAGADVVILAVPFGAAAGLAEVADFAGRVVVDVTNPVKDDFSGLQVGHTTSAAEEIAKAAADELNGAFRQEPALDDAPEDEFREIRGGRRGLDDRRHARQQRGRELLEHAPHREVVGVDEHRDPVGGGVHDLALMLLGDVLGAALDDDDVIGQFLECLAGVDEQHPDAAFVALYGVPPTAPADPAPPPPSFRLEPAAPVMRLAPSNAPVAVAEGPASEAWQRPVLIAAV